MGAYGGLCRFDDAVFRSQVLPAFAGGESHPLIQATLDHVRSAHPYPGWAPSAYRGLAQLAPYYTPDMADCTLGRAFAVCDGRLYAPPGPPGAYGECWDYEDLTALFEWVVTRTTLSHQAVLGLRFRSLEQLFPETLLADGLCQELLTLLDRRGRYWAYGTGGYGEGIHGWLDSDEAALLADGFTPIALDALVEHWSGDVSTAHQHATRLGEFANALGEAVAAGQGVLWGRDLRIFYDHGRWLSAAP
jgi:hypothetical protein